MPFTGVAGRRRAGPWPVGGLLLLFIALCAWPYVGWAWSPSLFDDDLTRVGSLRRSTLAASLFRPFNEHLAPLFELVSWLGWWGAGERVESIATAWLIAAYLATLATAAALVLVVRLESGSTRAGLAALALFGLQSVAVETTLWYSASSFLWSAAAALAAWYAVVRAMRAPTSRQRLKWLVGSVLLVGASPLFSAIGVLAGPLASFRLLLDARWRQAAVGRALVPLLGTLGYAGLVVTQPGLGQVVSASVRQHGDLGAASWAALRAPGLILAPALIGLPPDFYRMSDLLAALTTVALVVGVLGWAWYDPARRGLILVGLGWLGGGYAVAYLARAAPGDRWIFLVGRYHLFPWIGLVCWVAVVVGLLLDRLEAWRPLAGWVGLVVLAAVGLIVQGSTMNAVARRSFRFADQPAAIAATLRLEAICQAEQIPLDQAARIIDPTEPPWFPRPLAFNPGLYLFGTGPTVERWTDVDARHRVLAALSHADRESIFGGLNAASYPDQTRPGAPGTRVEESGRGEFVTEAGPLAFIKFAVPAEVDDAAGLELVGLRPGLRVEIWWAGQDGIWTPNRSIRLTTGTSPSTCKLEDLPHWRPHFARRFRVIRRAGLFQATDRPTLILHAR